jgi:hypothetical protein
MLYIHLDYIRTWLDEAKLSARGLTEHFGGKRRDSENIHNAPEDVSMLGVDIKTIIALQKALPVSAREFISPDSLRELSEELPLAREHKVNGELELVSHKSALEIAEEYRKTASLTQSQKFEPYLNSTRVDEEHSMVMDCLRIASDFTDSPSPFCDSFENFSDRVKNQNIIWVATSDLDKKKLLLHKEYLKKVENCVTSGALGELHIEGGSLEQLLESAERASHHDPANISMENEDLRIFHRQVKRRLTFVETRIREHWNDLYELTGTEDVGTYKSEYTPEVVTNFFIVANPNQDYVLLEAKIMEEVSWTVDEGHTATHLVSEELWNKYASTSD